MRCIRDRLAMYNFYVLLILDHPNCKFFIIHEGVHGLMETIDVGVSIIGFPIFGDQHQNLRISEENGLGIRSDIFTLIEETFEKNINRILNEPK